MTDTISYIQKLEDTAVLREYILRQAIQALQLPQASRGLDAGSGIGTACRLLTDAIGPHGHLVGLDASPELIAHAKTTFQEIIRSNRLSFEHGDVTHTPFQDHYFDWIWSCDCAGYPAGNLKSILKEFKRVVKPGGIVAILGWTSQNFLPGYYMFEHRLNAACTSFASALAGTPPENHFQRAMKWYEAAGFTDIQIKTFIDSVQAPLTADIQKGLAAMIEMLWTPKGSTLEESDIELHHRLCGPESVDYILKLPDYNGFFTYTMIWGNA